MWQIIGGESPIPSLNHKMSKPSLIRLLKKIYGSARNQELFPASINWQQGLYLSELLRKLQPRNILELGSGHGVAALWIQSAIPAVTKHISVDPWTEYPPEVLTALKKTNHTLITTHTSQQYLADLETKSTGLKPELIILDADNHFDGCMADLYFATKLLRPGGHLVVRNCWNPSVRLALRFGITNLPYRLEGVPSFVHWWIKHLSRFGLGWVLYHTTRHYTAEWCVLQKTAADTRPWNHFQQFS